MKNEQEQNMNNLTIKKASRLPLREEILQFELANKIKFPIDFFNFLMKFNPIEIEERYFVLNNISKELDIFYPFNIEHDLSLQSIFNNLNEIMFQNRYVAFGGDLGGWKFIISVQEVDYGSVYFCRTDEDLEDSIIFLAESFDNFLSMLVK
ncbi:SMI1/KNR4 family protein [Tenacibaculum sp. S7007]|uniref:SMI1/KNR4 family protein n=1 Tax=Tenacibaculum pelagium TaxID=2759527 RepID=A0A839ALK6_9FLAO|nr:SMI1/KNR4 family protein [Tenacibaculum pelagium]MBA6156012.1 SMI1/KNR4 family protein [Tenacibaculum pelagium]